MGGEPDQLENNEITLSSGVTVKILPFPAQLFQRIQEKALEEFPDPVPPKKTITVVDGTETVDDYDEEEYKVEKEANERDRNRWSSERVLGYCLKHCTDVDLAAWESTIRDLEETLYPFPKDPVERKQEFLTSYVFRTQGDYLMLTTTTLRLMMVTDPEVARRLEFFRREVERAAAPDAAHEAPGSDEVERVEVPPEGEGTEGG